MRFDEDIEIDPSFREERERVAAEAERDRRIRQEVVRVLSGEAEEDLAEDERLRLEQKEREAEEREAEERRRNSWWNKWFQALFTGEILTNARQVEAVNRTRENLLRAQEGLEMGVPPDLLLTDVEAAMEAMGEVTGGTVREDITARIFERFCVGK